MDQYRISGSERQVGNGLEDESGVYHLERLASGELVLVRADRQRIGRRERDMLYEAVRLSWRIDHTESLLSDTQRLVVEAAWAFPKSNAEMRGRTGGVYFVEDQAHPALIKIGFTGGSLMSRLRQLKAEQKCLNPRLLAVAFTPSYKIMEAGLHLIFEDCCAYNEWFQFEPVWDFLAGMKNVAGGAL